MRMIRMHAMTFSRKLCYGSGVLPLSAVKPRLLHGCIASLLNTAISGFRKQTRHVKTEDLQEVHLNISDYSGDEREEDFHRLQWAIKQLTEIERTMIMMALEEVPYEEIAETIGITQNNVRVRMNRTREKLRKLMSNTWNSKT